MFTDLLGQITRIQAGVATLQGSTRSNISPAAVSVQDSPHYESQLRLCSHLHMSRCQLGASERAEATVAIWNDVIRGLYV